MLHLFFLSLLVAAWGRTELPRRGVSQAQLPQLYSDPVDMWVDFAHRMCNARLGKRPFRKERCRLLVDWVENSGKAMLGQVPAAAGGGGRERMEHASNTGSLYTFREMLQSTCDMLAYAKNPTKHDIAATMAKFQELAMAVATLKKSNLETFASLPADAVEGLKRRGIALPELTAIDDFDLETLLDPEDEL